MRHGIAPGNVEWRRCIPLPVRMEEEAAIYEGPLPTCGSGESDGCLSRGSGRTMASHLKPYRSLATRLPPTEQAADECLQPHAGLSEADTEQSLQRSIKIHRR